MLTYHPKNDIYHCIYRIISIIKISQGQPIEIEKLKLLDFYFLFPHLAREVTIPRDNAYAYIKKEARQIPLPYETLPDKRRLYSELGMFQNRAIDILQSKKIIKEESNSLIEDENFRSKEILTLSKNNKFIENNFYKNLVNCFQEIPLLGENGLKKRTNLLEYRYDIT